MDSVEGEMENGMKKAPFRGPFRERICQNKKKNELKHNVSARFIGPSVEIRTQGLLNPIQARYQTSPHPDTVEQGFP